MASHLKADFCILRDGRPLQSVPLRDRGTQKDEKCFTEKGTGAWALHGVNESYTCMNCVTKTK